MLSHDSAQNPHNFKAEDVQSWAQEAMAEFRQIESETEQKIDVGFIYHDKKVGLFTKLMTLAYTRVFDKEYDPNLPVEREYLQVLQSQMSRLDSAELVIHVDSQEQKLDATIIMGRRTLNRANLSQTKAAGLDAYAKNPHERFLLTFLHELGHLVFEAKALVGQGSAPHSVYEQKFNFNNSYQHENLALLLETVIQDNPHYLKDSNRARFQALMGQAGLDSFEAKHLVSYQNKYSVLAKEMFADCFSAIMCARMPAFKGEPYHLLSDIEDARNAVSIGPAIFKEFQYNLMGHPFDHSTGNALAHLKTLIYENNIDLKNLNLNEIKNLCQAATNYGLARFMFEASHIQPLYSQFLNAISVAVPTPDLFGENAFLKASDIFNYLRPEDKKASLEKIQKFNCLFDILNDTNDNQTPTGDLVNFSEHSSIDKPQQTQGASLSQPQNHIEEVGDIFAQHPEFAHLPECFELAGELTNYHGTTGIAHTIAAYSYANFLQTQEKNQALKNQYQIAKQRVLVEATTASLENHNLSNKIENTRRDKPQATLDFTPETDKKLRDKIQNLKSLTSEAAKKALDQVYYSPPQINKFK